MKEALFQESFPFQSWASHHGLPIFLGFSFFLHLGALCLLNPHVTAKQLHKLYGNLAPTFQAHIASLQPRRDGPASSLTRTPGLEKNVIGQKSETQPLSPVESVPLLIPEPPPSTPWFRSNTMDISEWQKIYQEQQKNQLYQQTDMQLNALLSELPPSLNEDLLCSNAEGRFACDHVLPTEALGLLKTIYQISLQQYLWQLSTNPRTYQVREIRITFKF